MLQKSDRPQHHREEALGEDLRAPYGEGARVAVTEACALLADARGWTAAEAAERSAANARAAFEPAGWQ